VDDSSNLENPYRRTSTVEVDGIFEWRPIAVRLLGEHCLVISCDIGRSSTERHGSYMHHFTHPFDDVLELGC
jgi:hypothetical protein